MQFVISRIDRCWNTVGNLKTKIMSYVVMIEELKRKLHVATCVAFEFIVFDTLKVRISWCTYVHYLTCRISIQVCEETRRKKKKNWCVWSKWKKKRKEKKRSTLESIMPSRIQRLTAMKNEAKCLFSPRQVSFSGTLYPLNHFLPLYPYSH